MFERFTDPARRVVVLAQESARERGDDTIRSEHLLLGVCRATDSRGAALLAAHGVTLREVEDDLRRSTVSDRDALASVGIDLDEVRERVEDAFGPGALESTRAAGRRRRRWGHRPVDRGAKKVLELALREAVHHGDRTIGTEHVLLGMLHTATGRAEPLLAARGVTLAGMRAALDHDAPGAASG
ncbi:Clp protease N-terminal domain-containing protein [Actinomycetospora straminea]|uniref:Clp protease N-terminal domain-containing protein n=1 Tax=Actinomycetospora straminea TaxID=663607 RepID=A0ABP9DVN3_9PSEU|nr:Clp protease N-terminal domain-containing protein [Actinomycetospora straminea]MDD7936283.1 Clp protease N-terminal domain-containing protein [Actinomycetospora straminea]